MARVQINYWSVDNSLGGDDLSVHAVFDVTLSQTEARLDIPVHINMRLQERDRDRDSTHLLANLYSFRPYQSDDERVPGGWYYVGTYSESTTAAHWHQILNIHEIKEMGREELYLVALAIPDIYSHVGYSEEISFGGEGGTTFSPSHP